MSTSGRTSSGTPDSTSARAPGAATSTPAATATGGPSRRAGCDRQRRPRGTARLMGKDPITGLCPPSSARRMRSSIWPAATPSPTPAPTPRSWSSTSTQAWSTTARARLHRRHPHPRRQRRLATAPSTPTRPTAPESASNEPAGTPALAPPPSHPPRRHLPIPGLRTPHPPPPPHPALDQQRPDRLLQPLRSLLGTPPPRPRRRLDHPGQRRHRAHLHQPLRPAAPIQTQTARPQRAPPRPRRQRHQPQRRPRRPPTHRHPPTQMIEPHGNPPGPHRAAVARPAARARRHVRA